MPKRAKVSIGSAGLLNVASCPDLDNSSYSFHVCVRVPAGTALRSSIA